MVESSLSFAAQAAWHRPLQVLCNTLATPLKTPKIGAIRGRDSLGKSGRLRRLAKSCFRAVRTPESPDPKDFCHPTAQRCGARASTR